MFAIRWYFFLALCILMDPKRYLSLLIMADWLVVLLFPNSWVEAVFMVISIVIASWTICLGID